MSHPQATQATRADQPVDRDPLARFPRRAFQPDPQSQSLSRSYGSILPTSLTHIVLSARGSSPWRPAAVMSTTRSGVAPPDFHGTAAAHPAPQKARRSVGRLALSLGEPIPGPSEPSRRKENSPGDNRRRLRVRQRHRLHPDPRFGNINPIPFRHRRRVHRAQGPHRPAFWVLTCALGSTNSRTSAVLVKPFSTSALKVLA